MALPHTSYTAKAVIGVEGPAGLRPALVQAAADLAHSRRVATRAASSLSEPAGSAGTRRAGVDVDALAAAIRVDAGRLPGTLVLQAADADAERAAALANAVVGVLVAELGDSALASRREEDAAETLRLSRLQDIAAEAHRKLTALGGDALDPATGRIAATKRADALQARRDAIRSILTAGNPPLGVGRDVPPNIEALQAAYLDLTRQLAKARETLGERHTTIVGLQEAIRRSAAELRTAWTRLANVTEQELTEAKAHGGATNPGPSDSTHAAAIDAARAAARIADDNSARAAAAAYRDQRPRWHLVARASAPALAEGLSLPTRYALAAAAGLFALVLGLQVARRTGTPNAGPLAKVTPAPTPLRAAEPTFDLAFPSKAFGSEHPPALSRVALAASRAERVCVPPAPDATPLAMDETASTRAGPDLVAGVADVLPAIDAATPTFGIPVVLVATDEAGVETTPTVLALGIAAAAAGRRVLVVEVAQARPVLAAAVEAEAVPILVDVFGEIRVVLRADAGDGLIHLAPYLRDGARIAADLARIGAARAADALADEFDMVIVDGAGAADSAGLADAADALLRVGRLASPRDTSPFLAALGEPRGTFLGTIAAAVFVPQAEPPASRPINASAPAATRAPRAPASAHLRRPISAEARRRVGR